MSNVTGGQAPKVTALSLLELLEKSGALTPQQLADVRAHATKNPDLPPKAIVDRLVQMNELTRWQADQLMLGRHTLSVGRYKLLELLGTGNMGSVYRAFDPVHRRIVAVKVMAPQLVNNPESTARFQREAQVSTSVRHPNLIEAYEADVAGKLMYLVMEYVVGRDLKEMLSQTGPLPIGFACECVRQASLGLQHAHERGLVHRDIKPANLVVQWDVGGRPNVKVLDLGLAFSVSGGGSGARLTLAGQMIGTPDYISPEQAKDTLSADARSDVYSLGCTMFELLTGTLPFQGKNVIEKITARLKNQAPSARGIRSQIPAAVDSVLAGMLVADPAKRIQSTAEVARLLTKHCSTSMF